MLTHRGEVARIYFPPDANCLLSVADHCRRSTSYVNLIVIDKQPQLRGSPWTRLLLTAARGAGIWEWAGNDDGSREHQHSRWLALEDIVTMGTVAAAQILRGRLPQLSRVVNVFDLHGH